MPKEPEECQIVEVFSQVATHFRIAELIKQHSTNQEDIRCVALASLDLTEAREILDLGCGFGAFLEALKGRVHRHAVLTGLDIVPAYQDSFLMACHRSDIQGRFVPAGVSQINHFADDSYDIILCGFALYFFPQAIPEIARILKPTGVFIAITHHRGNMGELIRITKTIMQKNGMPEAEHLPIETIISRFCAENGAKLLEPWFNRIRIIDYRNALIFEPEDVTPIIEYFRFKSPLFLASATYDTEAVIHRVAMELERSALFRDGLRMSKNDRIFICSQRLQEERDP